MADMHDNSESDRDNLHEENCSAILKAEQLPESGIWKFPPKGIQLFLPDDFHEC